MKRFVRAEDFSVDQSRIVLGGRILTSDIIASAHIEQRVSAELLGLYGLVIAFVTFIAMVYTREPILFGAILAILCLGVYREIKRAWVLVMTLYQLGGFEVRGFTEREASVALQLIDSLRDGPQGRAGARST